MIQLYLLVLIIIFIGIFFTIKEHFQANLKCDSAKQRVKQWASDTDTGDSYLYGCNSLFKSDNKSSQIGIKLFWTKKIMGTKTVLIINTEDKDDTFIKDIKDIKHIDSVKKNDENDENDEEEAKIYTYELKENIIEGKTYFITVNYIDDEVIYVSNTLKITAISPVPHFKSSGFKLQQQNLMNLLRNKTFDIYL
jgi:hypothetical protein